MLSVKAAAELAWVDRPFRELTRLAWPIAVSMISYATMTLVDTLFVGRMGSGALAGVALAATAVFLILCFPLGLLQSTKIAVSQVRGAGAKLADCNAYLAAGLVLAILLGLLSLVVAWLVLAEIGNLTASDEAASSAEQYFWVRMLCTPAVLIYAALREARYGMGDARSPMLASLLGNIANIVLDYIFVEHAKMGVTGVAWATVVGHCIEAAFLLATQRQWGFGFFALRRRHMTELLGLGLPLGVQFTLESGSFTVLAVLISRLNELAMASHQIALQVIHFSFLPAYAVGEAASAMVGQAVGANHDGLVRPVARLALWVTSCYTLSFSLILVGTAQLISKGFTSDPALINATTALLYVAAVFQVFDGANIISRAILRGTGDVRMPAMICIVLTWCCVPTLMWLLGYKFGLGALGGWIGLCIGFVAAATVLWHRLENDYWVCAAQHSREERTGQRFDLGARSMKGTKEGFKPVVG